MYSSRVRADGNGLMRPAYIVLNAQVVDAMDGNGAIVRVMD